MLPETQRMPTSYLSSVLLDGAKAFSYRSGVRSLLGVPDNEEGKVAFSPSMPPVGFTYPNFQFIGKSYSPQYSLDEIVQPALDMRGSEVESSDEIISDNMQRFPSSRTGIEAVTYFGMQAKEEIEEKDAMPKAVAQQTALHPELDQQNLTSPISKQERNSVEPFAMPDSAGKVFERATIQIPGASEKSQNFPDSSFPAHKNLSSNKAVEQSQSPIPPIGVRSSATTSWPAGEERETELRSIPAMGIVHDSGEASQRGTAKNSTVSPSTSTDIGQDVADGDREQGDVLIQHASPPPRRVSRIRINGDKSTSNPSFDVAGHVDFGPDNRTSLAAARIEQLRNVERVLASRNSSQREQAPVEAQIQQQHSSRPAQQVVIVKQSSNLAKIPCAFWERSYLSRIRSRILR